MMVNVIIMYILYCLTYSVLGWVYESLYCSITNRTIINRGFFYGPYCPIYGFAAISNLLLLSRLSNPLLIFIYGMGLSVILEYLTSYMLEKVFKKRWWNYEKMPFNIKGRVCLPGAILFGLFSVSLIKIIHPLITTLIQFLIIQPLHILFIILPILMIDIIVSILKNIDIKDILRRN